MARGGAVRHRLGLSFLERSQRVIGLIGILVILAGTAVALLLTGGVLARTYPVAAHFEDAGGVAVGDDVRVAGLDVGTVRGLRIEGDRVVIELAVDRDVELPADSGAEVVIETLLGKRSVALHAGGQWDRPLRDVGVIPLDRTVTPVDITELNDVSVRLLRGSDAEALNELLDDVAEITEGRRREVTTLVRGLADVVEAVDDRREELGGLIEALRTLATTLGERDRTLVSLIDNLDPVLGNLADRQRDLEVLLEATAAASQETASLVGRNRDVLDDTLESLHSDLQVLADHQLELAAGIAYLEQSLQGYSSVGYSQGTCGQEHPPCARGVPNRWANIFVQSIGALGVDQILGPCGAIDQVIDRALGLDCADRPAGGTEDGDGGAGRGDGSPGLPAAPSVEALPEDVGDLIDSVVEGGLE